MDNEEYNTKGKFLMRLKEIAVKGQNNIVGRVQFLRMGQERNENIHSFVSRLRGAEIGCKFKKKKLCGVIVSYADNIIHDQIIWGMVEPIIQEKALSQMKDGDSLKDSMVYQYIREV